MLIHLKQVLTPAELLAMRTALQAPDAPWRDGQSSAGTQAVVQKNNEQLAQDSTLAAQLRATVLAALQRDALFFSAALPRRIFNPLFNRYSGTTNHYGQHIDGAVLHSRADGQWVRSDLSCTLFLSDAAEYEGGELVIYNHAHEQTIKLPAGDAVLYSGSHVHEVRPVTQGVRLASFFWIESMVRDDAQRQILFDMDMALLALRQQHGDSVQTTRLTGCYHNLLRLWAST